MESVEYFAKCVIDRAMRKRVFENEGPDQHVHCPLTESLDTTEYMNGKQTPG